MESPTVFDERERERVRKILLGVIVFVGILLYAGFNLWVWRYSKSGKAPSPAALWQRFQRVNAPQSVIPANAGIQSKKPIPIPTPRPTGPGEFACDPYGVCNKYGKEARAQYCTQTYADSLCLDECGNKEKQCSK